MIGIDSFGFDVSIDSEQQLRFSFPQVINNAREAKAALVAMAKACRA